MSSDKETLAAWFDYLKKLAPLFDMAYNGIVIIDEKGLIQVYNEAARKVLGIRERDLIGRPIASFNPEPWRDMWEIIKTGVPQIAKKTVIGESTIIANRTPIFFKGRVRGVMSIFQDISEYEKVGSELESFKRLNEELDTIIESSYDGLYITDGHSKTLRVNPAYERITGLLKKDLVDKSTDELVARGYFDVSVSLDVIKAKRAKTMMQHIKGGKTVMVTGNPVLDSRNEVVRVVTNVRDLTELNQLREELEETKQLTKRYQDELIEHQYLIQAEQELVIKSPAMRLVVQKALKIARVDSTVLLTGESGVGKDLLARFIHLASPRKENGFVKINCGAIPETLLESELFGYEKGAFTGARGEGKAGLLEISRGGSIFLDEIAELSPALQVKILSVIEDKEITRLGGTKSRQIDFRLIAATNRDLEAMVSQGHFRKDLYFRLTTLPLFVPPLRERREDIVPLINHFLRKFSKTFKVKKNFSQEVYAAMTQYAYPGNVRELMNIVEQLVVMSENQVIVREDLPQAVQVGSPSFPLSGRPKTLKHTKSDLEKRMIEEALRKHKTMVKAAQALGIDQSTVSRKIRRYGLGGYGYANKQ
jgi:PAS domain S-box-containing protein